jgi:hypothetical protein
MDRWWVVGGVAKPLLVLLLSGQSAAWGFAARVLEECRVAGLRV